jgi:hypothetical protein
VLITIISRNYRRHRTKGQVEQYPRRHLKTPSMQIAYPRHVPPCPVSYKCIPLITRRPVLKNSTKAMHHKSLQLDHSEKKMHRTNLEGKKTESAWCKESRGQFSNCVSRENRVASHCPSRLVDRLKWDRIEGGIGSLVMNCGG